MKMKESYYNFVFILMWMLVSGQAICYLLQYIKLKWSRGSRISLVIFSFFFLWLVGEKKVMFTETNI